VVRPLKAVTHGQIRSTVTFQAFLSTSQEIGWEEQLRNDQFCVEWDVKP